MAGRPRKSLVNRLNKLLFNRLIHLTHWLSEDERRDRLLGRHVSRALGAMTLAVKRGRRQPDIERAAQEWQRMFPSRKMVPIVEVQDDTVIAEIHSPCPYRGSGNTAGCYRMMEYDRSMMEAIGADFVVLRSQAQPGVQHCRVAITRDRARRADLVDAHRRDPGE